MFTAKVSSIISVKGVAPGSAEDIHAGYPTTEVQWINAKSSGQPEKGKVVVEIEMVSGSLPPAALVCLVDEDPTRLEMIEVKANQAGSPLITLFFNEVYENGFAQVVSYLLRPGMGLLGFGPEAYEQRETWSIQRKWVQKLTELMLPDRQSEILNLLRPAYHLHLAEEQAEKGASRFLGSAAYGKGQSLPKAPDGHPLFHLATLKLEDFQDALQHYSTQPHSGYLSFYLDIRDTDKAWPTAAEKRAIRHYEQPATDWDTAGTLSVTYKPRLELPRYDDCRVQLLELEDEEETAYEAILNTHRSLLDEHYDFEGTNKLLGYPDAVQSCVSQEAQALHNGSAHSAATLEDSTDWLLLLQVSPYAKWLPFFDTFGDGTIYFMIRKEDLVAGRFEGVQVVVQGS